MFRALPALSLLLRLARDLAMGLGRGAAPTTWYWLGPVQRAAPIPYERGTEAFLDAKRSDYG